MMRVVYQVYMIPVVYTKERFIIVGRSCVLLFLFVLYHHATEIVVCRTTYYSQNVRLKVKFELSGIRTSIAG